MATPFSFLFPNTQRTHTPNSPDPDLRPDNPRPKKTHKKKTNNKQPQRGMGVAQLERIRLQDHWLALSRHTHQFCYTGQCPGFAGADSGRVGGVEGWGSELPSIPKMDCYDEPAACSKKKRMNGDPILGIMGGNKPKYYSPRNQIMHPTFPGYSPHQGSAVHVGFHGAKIGKNHVITEYEFFPYKLHNNNNNNNNDNSSICYYDMESSSDHQGSASGCSSLTTANTAADEASPSIDLSLKL